MEVWNIDRMLKVNYNLTNIFKKTIKEEETLPNDICRTRFIIDWTKLKKIIK